MAQAQKKDMLLTAAPPTVAAEVIPLTPQQKPLWDQTRAKFLWEAPGFTHVLYKMMCPKDGERIIFTRDGVDTLATDGVFVYANPDFYFKLTLPQRVFGLGHEVVHGILNHANIMHGWRVRGKVTCPNGEVLDYDEDCMQHSADYIINAMLVASNIGKPIPDVYLEPAFIPHTDSLTQAYQKLYHKRSGGGGKPKPGKGTSMDKVLKPGQGQGMTPQQAKAMRNEAQWKTTVAGAMASAKARGLLSGSMKDMFCEFLEPTVSWDEFIQGWFKKKLGSGGWDFRRPDRRFIIRDIYAPSRSGHGAELVVIGIDSSGSVTQAMLERFMGEMFGVLQDVKPRRILIMWCDSSLKRVDEIEDTSDLLKARQLGAPGRGGTVFAPVFNKVKAMGLKPDAMIYFTDGDGPFPPEKPDYPVLWGNVQPGKHYPWGDVVNIPV